MARSPLTLAASVTSALPRVGVVSVAALTESAAGRYDSALVGLDDGRSVVVRVPATAEAATDLVAEVRALRALTPGVRALLPFRAPELLGETGLDRARVVVVDHLPGYRVDAAHVPAGPGIATSLGAALAALHSLPLSVVRTEGLPVRTPEQVRDDARRLIDRASATHRTPISLIARWTRAVENDDLWRFEAAVVLGGASAAAFLFDDVDGVPTITGALEWAGLSVGDPAADLQWLSAAPDAAGEVFDAYAAASARTPDALVRERARLYAELEFAKWLVHGYDADRADVLDDAEALLRSLADGTSGEDIVAVSAHGVDDAIALLDRVPERADAAGDTSLQTDTYAADDLSLWSEELPADTTAEREPSSAADQTVAEPPSEAPADDPERTQPIAPVDVDDFVPLSFATGELDAALAAPRERAQTSDWTEAQAEVDSARAADAALRRWLAD
ncbi:phosphotransferase [Microbacterium fluvii]|uniref:Phosphotransferase n=1 Tax=Microbacterium fluvii TaxID=415215 RepID=A0ABW2HC29_9MICO|nr:phosphotransferase [Microbacterium fluvii]MCU4672234.1 aminoglycoside phosphotransferase [Microbacterium fluvii]